MTDMTWGPSDAAAFGRSRVARRGIPQSALCAAALVLSAPLGLAMLYMRPVTPVPVAADLPAPATPAPAPVPSRAPLAPAAAPLRHYAALLDPSFISGTKPSAFAKPTALRAAFEPKTMAVPRDDQASQAPASAATTDNTRDQVALAEPADAAEPAVVPALPPAPALVKEIPLPAPRPDDLAGPARAHLASRQLASAMPEAPVAPAAPLPTRAPPGPAAAAPAAPAGEGNSFFDKLFSPLTRPGSALGYAAVEPGEIGRGIVDRYTAVYDISAHVVTLPNGTRLEAHSGLGAALDDPSSVAQHMRGATPPNLYELTPREALFHGVRALRLTPTGGTTYGRAGLLTHSYMLRGRIGESNGCVVFRDYPAFLAAYESGQVRRLLVVAHAS